MPTVAVALDYFPAVVDLPNGTVVNEARVIIADARVLVYVNQGGRAVVYFDEELVSSSGSGLRGYELQVKSGIVLVKKANGCGCGNPIRSMNPFPGKTRTTVPL